MIILWYVDEAIHLYIDTLTKENLLIKLKSRESLSLKKKQNNGHAISELLIPNNGNTTPIQGQYCKFRKINVKILGEREGVIPRAERLYNGLRLKGNVSHYRGKNK